MLSIVHSRHGSVQARLNMSPNREEALFQLAVEKPAEGRAAFLDAILVFREHRYKEALVLLDRSRDVDTSRLGSEWVTDPAIQAYIHFSRALLCAELAPAEPGRAEEARRDFAQARAQLKLALGDKPGHDRASDWRVMYQAASRQSEAKALFQAKGIPLPEPDAK
jgi:hypothetical protein